jgi:hypothetical protein
MSRKSFSGRLVVDRHRVLRLPTSFEALGSPKRASSAPW